MYMGERDMCTPVLSRLERLKKDSGCDNCDRLRDKVERLKKEIKTREKDWVEGKLENVAEALRMLPEFQQIVISTYTREEVIKLWNESLNQRAGEGK
jgi:hypothetical protein